MLKQVAEKTVDFSPRDFRDALSTFATGVTIVTAPGLDGSPVGMTASSFNSVSTEPPLILWSVTKTALSAESFRQATHFAVHVLATDQMTLSSNFAKSGADKFADCDYRLDDNHVPVIADCATRFDCSTWAVYEGGDHWIIVGEVKAIERERKEGLVFGGGTYATASPLTMPTEDATPLAKQQSPIESVLFYHLSRAYHQMGHRFHEAVRDNGLTLTEWRILANLHGGMKLSFAEVAARTFLDPHSLDDVIDTLENDGLCEIGSNQTGRFVKGTKSGSARVERLFELSRKLEDQALGGATQTQRDDLVDQLKKIVAQTGPVQQEK